MSSHSDSKPFCTHIADKKTYLQSVEWPCHVEWGWNKHEGADKFWLQQLFCAKFRNPVCVFLRLNTTMESCKSKAVVFHCVVSEQKAWQAYSNNIFQRKEGELFEQMCGCAWVYVVRSRAHMKSGDFVFLYPEVVQWPWLWPCLLYSREKV